MMRGRQLLNELCLDYGKRQENRVIGSTGNINEHAIDANCLRFRGSVSRPGSSVF
jgi:hypothetical protein